MRRDRSAGGTAPDALPVGIAGRYPGWETAGAQTPGAIFSVRWIVEPSVRFSAAMPVGARARKSTLRAFRSDMKALST